MSLCLTGKGRSLFLTIFETFVPLLTRLSVYGVRSFALFDTPMVTPISSAICWVCLNKQTTQKSHRILLNTLSSKTFTLFSTSQK
jgi:hypothetical protein